VVVPAAPEVKVSPPKVIVCPLVKAAVKLAVADSVFEAVPAVTTIVGAVPAAPAARSVTMLVFALAAVKVTILLEVPVTAPVE